MTLERTLQDGEENEDYGRNIQRGKRLILAILRMKGEVGQELFQRVMEEADAAVLTHWFLSSLEAATVECFAESIGCSGAAESGTE